VNGKSRMGTAALRKSFFEGSGLALGDLLLDLFRQPFTLAARSKIPFQILIPRRFFHALKPDSELPPFNFRQIFDRFFDGFKRHTVNLTWNRPTCSARWNFVSCHSPMKGTIVPRHSRSMHSVQNLSLPVALAALGCASLAVYQSQSRLVLAASDRPGKFDDKAWHSERAYPPLVFTGHAWLECSISSTRAGRQAMRTVSGQGFDFDMAMQPIKDGLVRVKAPGMFYKFNAFPHQKVPATFTGIGKGDIVEMKAEVEVDVKRFSQPGGAGTEISFKAADINADSAYIEFTGVFVRAADNKRFPFRVLFGGVTEGNGTVQPGVNLLSPKPPGSDLPLLSKAVTIGSASQPAIVTTAMYEAEDDVAKLR
jgi:hypothetical protein